MHQMEMPASLVATLTAALETLSHLFCILVLMQLSKEHLTASDLIELI